MLLGLQLQSEDIMVDDEGSDSADHRFWTSLANSVPPMLRFSCFRGGLHYLLLEFFSLGEGRVGVKSDHKQSNTF